MISRDPEAGPVLAQPVNGNGSGIGNVGSPTNPTTKPKDPKASYASLFNKKQLAVLCLARLTEPLAATSIQSYMFYQMKYFDPSASDAQVSTQAGILTGAKTAAQVCTGIMWGRVADADWGGRKLVLMIGLLSAGLACVGYGLSRGFAAAVTWQIVGGSLNSNVSMVRCVVAEMYPEKRYRARALMLLPLCANAGMLLGPLVGGLLSSQPGMQSISSYPYALPNLCIASLYFVSAIGVFFGVEETLVTYNEEVNIARRARVWLRNTRSRLNMSQSFEYSIVGTEPPNTSGTRHFIDSTAPSQDVEPGVGASKPVFHRMWTFNVLCTMLAHFVISGHLGTFSTLWSVFLSTPIERAFDEMPHHSPFKFGGGLGMRPRDVGIIMSLLGVIIVFLQVVIYPRLNDRVGTLKIWRVALYAFPVAYFCAPFPALIEDSSNGQIKPDWVAITGVLFIFGIGRTGVTPATTLLINDCTPHPSVRATIHSTATVLGNLSRSIFPVTALAIFGVGLKIGVVGLAFWCLTGLAGLSCLASRWVKDGSREDDND